MPAKSVLRCEMRAILGDFDDPESYKGFPHVSTFDTRLDSTEVNLLSSLSAWVVAADQNADLFRGMYQPHETQHGAWPKPCGGME